MQCVLAAPCALCTALRPALPERSRRWRHQLACAARQEPWPAAAHAVPGGTQQPHTPPALPSAAAAAPAAVPRRGLLLAAAALLSALTAGGSSADEASSLAASVEYLQNNAMQAYARQDYSDAIANLNKLVDMAPGETRWREMRAQAKVDAKDFPGALVDFDEALRRTPEGLDRARLLAGRGLALEGVADWVAATKDYDESLRLAVAAGASPDPFVLNSRGNCHASLGEWQAARADYLASAELFQTAAGFRGRRGGSSPRLDGSVFATGNAALMLAQLGDEPGAVHEMQAVSRRAPGNADMRAALAALYWSQGKEGAAESEWEFACNNISVGCAAYRDEDWLFRIRRWPPVMVQKMHNFLSLRSAS